MSRKLRWSPPLDPRNIENGYQAFFWGVGAFSCLYACASVSALVAGKKAAYAFFSLGISGWHVKNLAWVFPTGAIGTGGLSAGIFQIMRNRSPLLHPLLSSKVIYAPDGLPFPARLEEYQIIEKNCLVTDDGSGNFTIVSKKSASETDPRKIDTKVAKLIDELKNDIGDKTPTEYLNLTTGKYGWAQSQSGVLNVGTMLNNLLIMHTLLKNQISKLEPLRPSVDLSV